MNSFSIACYDPRFRRSVNAFLNDLHPEDTHHDDTRVPGGAGNRNALEEALRIGVEKHAVSRATLGVHEDCAYGAQVHDLHRAARLARELGVESVTLVYFKLDGSHEIIEEDIAFAG